MIYKSVVQFINYYTQRKYLILEDLYWVKKIFSDRVSGMLRLDPPNDRRNLYDWHQDHSYYRQNKSGKNGLVISAALHIIKKKESFKGCSKSHNLGFLKVRTKRKVLTHSTILYEIVKN